MHTRERGEREESREGGRDLLSARESAREITAQSQEHNWLDNFVNHTISLLDPPPILLTL